MTNEKVAGNLIKFSDYRKSDEEGRILKDRKYEENLRTLLKWAETNRITKQNEDKFRTFQSDIKSLGIRWGK